jgi:hypothetical protein
VEVVDFSLLGQRLKVHRKAAPAFERVAKRLEEALAREPSLRPYLTKVGGTFVWRKIANTERQGAHSYGVSMGLNVARSHSWARGMEARAVAGEGRGLTARAGEFIRPAL